MNATTSALVAGASALTALGIIWAALRRAVRAVVDMVTVVRELLQLQPRVLDLGERLVELVDHHQDHAARIERLETRVFPPSKETPNA